MRAERWPTRGPGCVHCAMLTLAVMNTVLGIGHRHPGPRGDMLASPLPASVQLLPGLTAVREGLLSESTRTACGSDSAGRRYCSEEGGASCLGRGAQIPPHAAIKKALLLFLVFCLI